MITELQAGLDRPMSRQYGTGADDAGVTRTAASLEANGINALRAADAEEAKRIVLGLIPDDPGWITAPRTRSRSRVSPTRSRSPVATSASARGSGAWTARPRPTRSAACPRLR